MPVNNKQRFPKTGVFPFRDPVAYAVFLSKVNVGDPDDCWTWEKAKDKDGYGKVMIAGIAVRSHRAAYWLAVGDFDDNCCVLHRCDNPPCCNPSHLWLGTNSENTADKIAKGRAIYLRGDQHPARLHPEKLARGDSHGSRSRPDRFLGDVKLCPSDVAVIRTRLDMGEMQEAIARDYGVIQATISSIATGRTWSNRPVG